MHSHPISCRPHQQQNECAANILELQLYTTDLFWTKCRKLINIPGGAITLESLGTRPLRLFLKFHLYLCVYLLPIDFDLKRCHGLAFIDVSCGVKTFCVRKSPKLDDASCVKNIFTHLHQDKIDSSSTDYTSDKN